MRRFPCVTVLAALATLFVSCDGTGGNTQPDISVDVDPDVVMEVEQDTWTDIVEDELTDDGCVPEQCNYEDDDCDTVVDNGFDLSSDVLHCGACGFVCSNANAEPACIDGLCMIASCNEGFHDVNGNPYDGCEYECTRTVINESDADGTCTDGQDNDCDGRTDGDDLDCSSCVPEYCNGLDDDCDTLTDEDFDLRSDPLNCGECFFICPARPHATPQCILGECHIQCEPGWENLDGNPANGCESSCTPATEPDEYSCDGRDDDCDGLVDEDYIPYICGSGACVANSVCVSGSEVCEPLAPLALADQLCDGIDNDCDGSVDEEYIPVYCYGACAPTARCVGGEEICGAPAEDLDVTCDGIDGDCDNEIDEDHIPYSCGIGVCVTDSVCVDGSETCTPLSPPFSSDIQCDGLDEDCSGTADEDYIPYTCGSGVCVRNSTCTAASESCTQGAPTGDDSDCDTVDENCNGTADENYVPTYTCGIGVCQRSSTCTAGVESCTQGTGTGTDSNCNGLDENCNGTADENYVPYACGTGACRRNSTCSSGIESCSAGAPTGDDSDCDGIDDDCDGWVDESYVPYTCGTGACARSSTCTGGYASCTAGLPAVESCNGIDDDCDGAADDGTGVSLCGSIPNGTPACTGGACIISSCTTNYYNLNGIFADGCECGADSYDYTGADCDHAYDLGTVLDSSAQVVTVTGRLVPAGDVDWFVITASDDVDSVGDEFEFEVAFITNPGNALRFDVYRGNCSTVACTAVSDCFNWYTDFRSGSGTTATGENPCRTTPTLNYNMCTSNTSAYYIRVYRASGTTTCTDYVLRISNNSPSFAAGCL